MGLTNSPKAFRDNGDPPVLHYVRTFDSSLSRAAKTLICDASVLTLMTWDQMMKDELQNTLSDLRGCPARINVPSTRLETNNLNTSGSGPPISLLSAVCRLPWNLCRS